MQPDDSVMSVSYLLEEPSLWHEMHVAPAEVPGPAWCVGPGSDLSIAAHAQELFNHVHFEV